MTVGKLTGDETIIGLGEYNHSQWRDIILPRTNSIKHCVGTIDIPGIARGTACLLENGQILTCLHNILNYEVSKTGRLELVNPTENDIFVHFEKNGNLYKYKVTDIHNSGLDKLRAYGSRAICFDYALLSTDRNPLLDLGSGLKPDCVDHFSSACVTDPSRTLAVSGPYLTTAPDGRINVQRYVSLSDNEAGLSTQYHYGQVGTHPTAPGFSGLAIVPITDRSLSLYALHSYRDSMGTQGGVKISEINHSMRSGVVGGYYAHNPYILPMLENWYEVLTKAKRELNGSVTRGAVIDFDEAVKILRSRGDIMGDSRGEVEKPAKAAWGGVLRHDKHLLRGLPHLHHPEHTDRKYPGHAFYPGAAPRGK